MILIDPPEELLPKLEGFFTSIGFQGLTLTTAEEHDRKIAYTSQLAHLIASSYVKSPTAMEHLGFAPAEIPALIQTAQKEEKHNDPNS